MLSIHCVLSTTEHLMCIRLQPATCTHWKDTPCLTNTNRPLPLVHHSHSVCEHTGTQSWSVGLPCALCPFANCVSVNQWVRLKGLCSPEPAGQYSHVNTWKWSAVTACLDHVLLVHTYCWWCRKGSHYGIHRTEVMVLYVIGLHRQCGAVSVLCYYSVGIENGESAHTQWYSVWGALETWRRQV